MRLRFEGRFEGFFKARFKGPLNLPTCWNRRSNDHLNVGLVSLNAPLMTQRPGYAT